MDEIDVLNLQIRQLALPNPRLEKRQEDRVVPAVPLCFKQQRLVLIFKQYVGFFLLSAPV